MYIKGYIIDKQRDIDSLDIKIRELKLKPAANFIVYIAEWLLSID